MSVLIGLVNILNIMYGTVNITAAYVGDTPVYTSFIPENIIISGQVDSEYPETNNYNGEWVPVSKTNGTYSGNRWTYKCASHPTIHMSYFGGTTPAAWAIYNISFITDMNITGNLAEKNVMYYSSDTRLNSMWHNSNIMDPNDTPPQLVRMDNTVNNIYNTDSSVPSIVGTYRLTGDFINGKVQYFNESKYINYAYDSGTSSYYYVIVGSASFSSITGTVSTDTNIYYYHSNTPDGTYSKGYLGATESPVFVAGEIPAEPSTVVVTGAGTSSVNGTYTVEKVWNGHNQYTNGTNYLRYMYDDDMRPLWVFMDSTWLASNQFPNPVGDLGVHVFYTTYPYTVITGPYVLDDGGTSPVPTVTTE